MQHVTSSLEMTVLPRQQVLISEEGSMCALKPKLSGSSGQDLPAQGQGLTLKGLFSP